mmetsp:Transcript_8879/g.27323  ORF Transcript_8879/g.27323 Transcript_8879/m.27323 type:complete len:230 (-) Transcript_8879:1203-1892(-)
MRRERSSRRFSSAVKRVLRMIVATLSAVCRVTSGFFALLFFAAKKRDGSHRLRSPLLSAATVSVVAAPVSSFAADDADETPFFGGPADDDVDEEADVVVASRPFREDEDAAFGRRCCCLRRSVTTKSPAQRKARSRGHKVWPPREGVSLRSTSTGAKTWPVRIEYLRRPVRPSQMPHIKCGDDCWCVVVTALLLVCALASSRVGSEVGLLSSAAASCEDSSKESSASRM